MPTGQRPTRRSGRAPRDSSTVHTDPELAASERPLLTGLARIEEGRSRSTSSQTPDLKQEVMSPSNRPSLLMESPADRHTDTGYLLENISLGR